jgi:hypothetical protein
MRIRDPDLLNELSDCHPELGRNDPQPEPKSRFEAHRGWVAENDDLARSNEGRHNLMSLRRSSAASRRGPAPPNTSQPSR